MPRTQHTLTVNGQTPGVLDANLLDIAALNNPLDASVEQDAIAKFLEDGLFQPSSTAAATFTLDNTDFPVADMAQRLACALHSQQRDIESEDVMNHVFEQGLADYQLTNQLTIDQAMLIQAAVSENLDLPDPVTIYNANDDIIPSAKGLLANKVSFATWFASLGFFAKIPALGASFADAQAFEKFKEFTHAFRANYQSVLPTETQQAFDELDKIKLDEMAELFRVRNSINDMTEPFSFARCLAHCLYAYTAQTRAPEYGIMPFSLSESLVPHLIMLVNVNAHRNSSARAITDFYNTMRRTAASSPPPLRPGKIHSLNKVARNAAAVSAAAAAASRQADAIASTYVPIAKKRPSAVNLTRFITQILSHMSSVTCSHNPYKAQHRSFARPNRRDPDNFNLKGVSTSTRYHPDIHIYADTSGSISEEDYKDMMDACIQLARKLDVNLYFNSFSDYMSTATLLKTKSRSLAAVRKQFSAIPKVDGGTDYVQIWDYICASPKRRREFSLIITDFAWTAPNLYHEHPENLYYAPVSNHNWDRIRCYAEEFVQSMGHIEPNIRKRLLC